MKKICVFLILIFVLSTITAFAEAEKVWTREYLNDAGISNDRISFIDKVICVDGKEFYRVQPVDGKTYATKSYFEKAVNDLMEGKQIFTTEYPDGRIEKMSYISTEE